MSLRRTATSAAIWGVLQKWGYHAIRLAVFVVPARLLAPEQRRALWQLLAQRIPAHGARS